MREQASILCSGPTLLIARRRSQLDNELCLLGRRIDYAMCTETVRVLVSVRTAVLASHREGSSLVTTALSMEYWTDVEAARSLGCERDVWQLLQKYRGHQ
jgi:hypothetical protein